LLNAIEPGLTLKTGDLGAMTQRGKHTTTQAELIPILEGHAWLADTPGLMALEFWKISPEEVAYGFRDIRNYAGNCQFGDCTHRAEPGCAVREAVATGKVNSRRLDSYIQLFNEAIVSDARIAMKERE
jgi:ribosome biogenesis GTPase